MTNIQIALSKLNEDETLKITPEGFSMCPTFVGERDDIYVKRPVFPLKRGDIALYRRDSGIYVIHRVHHVVKVDDMCEYYMIGDNQTKIEGPLREEQIHGITKYICRKGKMIDCEANHFYRFLSLIWLRLRPFRPLIRKLW